MPNRNTDPRWVGSGSVLPSEGYADQPYVVKTDDGAWLCTMTTGPGHEGDTGQHVISLRRSDHGLTWSAPVSIEPSDGPPCGYSVLLKVPSGRVYCFYNHNTDEVREILGEAGQKFSRVDSCGYYVFRFSDDHGQSWSAKRYVVPVRPFACDRDNIYGGSLRFFWNVGRPIVAGGAMILPHHKVGAMGEGFFAQSEGAFLRSRNILTEPNPEKIEFETLPLGDVGLRAPAGGGRVAEEQSVVELSDGSLFCVYRTLDGYAACAYSRDQGETWTAPAYVSHEPGGRRMKNPRAANFVWRCNNGRYLHWFHNHGGSIAHRDNDVATSEPSAHHAKWDPYEDRNPAWLSAGVERDTPEGKILVWSEPEIVLYDEDPLVRVSYPDLIEDAGDYFITETQKLIGRVHRVDPALIEGLFAQHENAEPIADTPLVDLPGAMPDRVPMPRLPDFRMRPDFAPPGSYGGFSIELEIEFSSLRAGQVILDSRKPSGSGLAVLVGENGTIRLQMHDGRQVAIWDCDPGVLRIGTRHHVVLIVDAGPHIITYVIDGHLCDGADHRPFGWGRFSPFFRTANGSPWLRLAPDFAGTLHRVRIFNRAIRTSEAVRQFRAWLHTGSLSLVRAGEG